MMTKAGFNLCLLAGNKSSEEVAQSAPVEERAPHSAQMQPIKEQRRWIPKRDEPPSRSGTLRTLARGGSFLRIGKHKDPVSDSKQSKLLSAYRQQSLNCHEHWFAN
ncbi:unnamed protein product [Natator depressus]